jgi:hypothetical protein
MKLCPRRDHLVNFPDHPNLKNGDRITTRVVIHLGIADRIRTFLFGKAVIVVKTSTEFICGDAKSNSIFFPTIE